MYPLHLKSEAGGFAVANNEAEHRALTAQGYEPKLIETIDPEDSPNTEPADELAALRAQAASRGIKVPGTWGIKRLSAELAK